jgi:hypothetical protein
MNKSKEPSGYPAKEIVCEGRCSREGCCVGNLEYVAVKDRDGKDWGNFWYCWTAIEEDRLHNFIVTTATLKL